MRLLSVIPKVITGKIKKRSLYPLKMTIALTYRCNSMCRTCNIWQKKELWGDISPDVLKTCISYFKNSLVWLDLTGGEIHLIEDLPSLVLDNIVACSDLESLSFTTNGLLPEKVKYDVVEILKKVPRHMSVVYGVSIDGIGEDNDSIRGINGAFDKGLSLIKELLEIEKDFSNFWPYVTYTVSHYNCGKFKEFIDYMLGEGIPPDRIKLTIEHNTSYYERDDSEDWSWDWKRLRMDIEAYLDLLRRWNNAGLIRWLKYKFYEYFVSHMEKFAKNPNKLILPCKAGITSLFLDPFGKLFLCTQWDYWVGNIKKDRVEIDWQRWLEGRKLVENGMCCGCWTPCESEINWLMSLPKSLWF